MNPQERACLFPLREDSTLKEPYSGSFFMNFESDVVVCERIRGRKPNLNSIPQLITYGTGQPLTLTMSEPKNHERNNLLMPIDVACIVTSTSRSAGR